MDAPPPDPSSPRSRLLQGPRPPRLQLRLARHSHEIKKPAVTLSPPSHHLKQQPPAKHQHQHPRRRAPAVVHAKPGEFMALVQSLTGGASATAAPAHGLDPKWGPAAAPSPAARLAAMETAVRRPPRPLPAPSYEAADDGVDDGFTAALGLGPPSRPGILSPAAAALPPAASSWQFTPALPPFNFNTSRLSWHSELFPILHTAGGTLLATPTILPSPATASVLKFMKSNIPDIESGSGHGEEAKESGAGAVGDTERRGKAEPSGGGDTLVGVDLDSSIIRRLFQKLVHLRNAIPSSSGALPSHAWFSDDKTLLCSHVQKCLEDLHYRMTLSMLGTRNGANKVMSNVSRNSSKTTSGNSIQLSSYEEEDILFNIDALGYLEHGSLGLPGAVVGNYSDMVSHTTFSVVRGILLCRGILGITSIVGAEGTKKTPELPVFASDDLTYGGHSKGIGTNDGHSIPARVTDPIYLLPIFIRSLLYLDLSSCSSLTRLPSSIGDLPNLVALNLSNCYSLQTLSVSLGRLKNLQILVLSCCRELRSLPLSLCELSKLRLLDLAGYSSLENLPDSVVNLGHLENLNLSDCKELKELPQPFGNLQELKYLNLSGSHGIDLDVEYLCKLVNLKCLTLLPLTNIQGFPRFLR